MMTFRYRNIVVFCRIAVKTRLNSLEDFDGLPSGTANSGLEDSGSLRSYPAMQLGGTSFSSPSFNVSPFQSLISLLRTLISYSH